MARQIYSGCLLRTCEAAEPRWNYPNVRFQSSRPRRTWAAFAQAALCAPKVLRFLVRSTFCARRKHRSRSQDLERHLFDVQRPALRQQRAGHPGSGRFQISPLSGSRAPARWKYEPRTLVWYAVL